MNTPFYASIGYDSLEQLINDVVASDSVEPEIIYDSILLQRPAYFKDVCLWVVVNPAGCVCAGLPFLSKVAPVQITIDTISASNDKTLGVVHGLFRHKQNTPILPMSFSLVYFEGYDEWLMPSKEYPFLLTFVASSVTALDHINHQAAYSSILLAHCYKTPVGYPALTTIEGTVKSCDPLLNFTTGNLFYHLSVYSHTYNMDFHVLSAVPADKNVFVRCHGWMVAKHVSPFS